MANPQYVEYTIPDGGNSVSGSISNGAILRSVYVTAASGIGDSLSFAVSNSPSGPWLPLYNEGTLYSLTIGASRVAAIPDDKQALFVGHKYLQITNRSSGVAANVTGGAKIFGLVFDTAY